MTADRKTAIRAALRNVWMWLLGVALLVVVATNLAGDAPVPAAVWALAGGWLWTSLFLRAVDQEIIELAWQRSQR